MLSRTAPVALLLSLLTGPGLAQGLLLGIDSSNQALAIDSVTGIAVPRGPSFLPTITGFGGGCMTRDQAGVIHTIAGGSCLLPPCLGASEFHRIDPLTGIATATGVIVPGYHDFSALAFVAACSTPSPRRRGSSFRRTSS